MYFDPFIHTYPGGNGIISLLQWMEFLFMPNFTKTEKNRPAQRTGFSICYLLKKFAV